MSPLRDLAGILESDKLATAGQWGWIFEFALPTPFANDAIPSCRTRS
jgi:hypothetical protein